MRFCLRAEYVFQWTLVAVLAAQCVSPGFGAGNLIADCRDQFALGPLTSDTVRVVSLNMSHGRGTALNQMVVSKQHTYENLNKIAQILGEANLDVVALQEADAPSRWSGSFDHVGYVAQRAGFPCLVHGLHSRTWIADYGTAILSRIRPLMSQSSQFSPSWPSKQKGFVTATLPWSVGRESAEITFVSVHFDFLRSAVRDKQLQELVATLSEIGGPLVVMGDFNSEWQQDASHVRELGRALQLRAYSPDQDGLGTYKSQTGKRLDWILVSDELEFRDYRVLPDVVADHFAVYAEISYTRRTQ